MSDNTSADTRDVSAVPVATAWKVVFGLLLLRLCLGWHFFSEGTKKLTYDQGQGTWEVHVPTEVLFRQATGPFADLFKNQLPGFHDWENLLAVPQQSQPLSSAEIAERRSWLNDYKKRRANAAKEAKPMPVEFPEYAPYAAWANQIIEDLRPRLKAFTEVDGISADQAAEAAELFQRRHQQLADFLGEQEEAIEEYQHELWRLQSLQAQQGAKEIPYRKQRVAAKQSETSSTGSTLVSEVRGIQHGLQNDLRGLLTPDQRNNDALADAVEAVLVDQKERRLQWLNVGVTALIISVGACLLLGLFTRLAAVGGVLFLLSVMVTQLPWVEGAKADFFYYQLVECAALISLLAFDARRLPGIDYILCGLWCLCCGTKKANCAKKT
ncbi:MAG: hypothetical protein MI725_03070 [Pirellulales bacterium]|nr:hypothetical protein [Pirellulales bacterium]